MHTCTYTHSMAAAAEDSTCAAQCYRPAQENKHICGARPTSNAMGFPITTSSPSAKGGRKIQLPVRLLCCHKQLQTTTNNHKQPQTTTNNHKHHYIMACAPSQPTGTAYLHHPPQRKRMRRRSWRRRSLLGYSIREESSIVLLETQTHIGGCTLTSG